MMTYDDWLQAPPVSSIDSRSAVPAGLLWASPLPLSTSRPWPHLVARQAGQLLWRQDLPTAGGGDQESWDRRLKEMRSGSGQTYLPIWRVNNSKTSVDICQILVQNRTMRCPLFFGNEATAPTTCESLTGAPNLVAAKRRLGPAPAWLLASALRCLWGPVGAAAKSPQTVKDAQNEDPMGKKHHVSQVLQLTNNKPLFKIVWCIEFLGPFLDISQRPRLSLVAFGLQCLELKQFLQAFIALRISGDRLQRNLLFGDPALPTDPWLQRHDMNASYGPNLLVDPFQHVPAVFYLTAE